MIRSASSRTGACMAPVLVALKTLCRVTFSIAMVSSAARAWGQEAKATAKDSVAVVFATYERLFMGIAMSDVRRDRAIDVIRKAFHQTVRPRSAAVGAWPQVKLVLLRRDSTLRSLLKTTRELDQFDRQVARERAHWRK